MTDVTDNLIDPDTRFYAAIAAEEADPKPGLYWLTFVDKGVPDADGALWAAGFLGAVVIEAIGPVHAIRAAHDAKIDPGGQVGCLMHQLPLDAVPPEQRDRLLDAPEAAALADGL